MTLACAHQAQLISRAYREDLAGAEEHVARWSRFLKRLVTGNLLVRS